MEQFNQQHHITNPSDLIRANEYIERSVIGTLLSVPNAFMDICEGLSKECFYNPFYADIFGVLRIMDNENAKIDVLTVSERMKREGIKFDIVELMQIPNSYTFDLYPYTLLVKEKAVERGVLSICMESAGKVHENNDVGDILFDLTSKAEKLQENLIGSESSSHISEVCKQSLIELKERIKRREEGKIAGVTTGLVDMDRHTRGWKNKTLIVIGARPGMGKTATMLHLIRSAASSNVPVCVFSLEMGERELIDRLIVGESGVRSDAFDAGVIPNDHMEKIENAAQKLSNLPIYIDDTPSVTIQYIRSRCRIMKRQGRCEMVAIDYLGLMNGIKEKNGNREQEIASITKGCKSISKELDIPVILLAQLNRECEKRADKRPMLSDLRESGSIEQDADIVMFVHRPKQYGLTCEYEGREIENGIEFIFAKFRSGSVGTIYAQHNESLTKLYDINTNNYQEDNFNRPQLRNYSEPQKDDTLPF